MDENGLTSRTKKRGRQWALRGVQALALALPLLAAAIAAAQDAAPPSDPLYDLPHLLRGLIDTVIFGVLGIGLLILGYRAFAAMVPWDLNKEIEVDQNNAAAIVVGSLFLGVAIIIAAVLTS